MEFRADERDEWRKFVDKNGAQVDTTSPYKSASGKEVRQFRLALNKDRMLREGCPVMNFLQRDQT